MHMFIKRNSNIHNLLVEGEMTKKPRLKSISALKKEADKLWSRIIHEKWNETCAVCGSHERPQAHHFRSRRFTATRWNTDNGILLCSGCHYGRAHKDYEWIRREFIAIHGVKMVDRLWNESHKLIKINREYLTKIIDKLRGEYDLS